MRCSQYQITDLEWFKGDREGQRRPSEVPWGPAPTKQNPPIISIMGQVIHHWAGLGSTTALSTLEGMYEHVYHAVKAL